MSYAFIIGCARSGTSILGELLAAHPDVAYQFELQRLWQSVPPHADGSHRLTAADATPSVCDAIRGQLAARRGSARWLVEKSPRNALRVPFLRAVFPDCRIVHLVRDGRDVACSLVPGCGGDKWRHLRPTGWRMLHARHAGAVRCAHVWKAVLEMALTDLAVVPHLQLRYEDLVHDPPAASARLLDYLDLRPHAAVEAFGRHIQDETAGGYHAWGQTQWYRPNHSRRIGRWQENLTAAERQAIEPLLRPLLSRLGYEVMVEEGVAA